MTQIITPPPVDLKEQASKDWYRAEALRMVVVTLTGIYKEIETEPARSIVQSAIMQIERARRVLVPSEVKRVRVK